MGWVIPIVGAIVSFILACMGLVAFADASAPPIRGRHAGPDPADPESRRHETEPAHQEVEVWEFVPGVGLVPPVERASSLANDDEEEPDYALARRQSRSS